MKLKKQAALFVAAAFAKNAIAQDGAYGASACSVTTMYIPVTYTITSGVPVSNSTTPDTTYTSTTTHTHVVTETSTVTATSSDQSTISSMAVDPTTASPSYAYTVNSMGETQWVNGMSPSSGASLATIIRTIVMQPVPQDDSATTSHSTSTEFSTETVTPPPYTSTVYSFVSPDLTSTSTSTHYVTYTLSEVSSPASITTTRTTFLGMSSGGWNASSSTESTQPVETEGPTSTTITVITYYGTGTRTTSTYTTWITTTVQTAYTTTISQVVESSISGSSITTFTTGVPVTITPGSSGVSFSTSVTAPGPVSISSQSSGATVNPAAATQTSVLSAPLMNNTSNSGTAPYPQATTGSSNGTSVSASGAPTVSGNATAPVNTQPPNGGPSGTSATTLPPDSITHTISAATLSGTSSVLQSPQAEPSSSQSLSDSAESPVQITNTVSSTASLASPRFSANSTISLGPKGRPSPSSLESTESLSNSTSSSVYGYTIPSLSTTSDVRSQTPRVSISSPSVPTRSPPPLSSGSSSPSTLTTSKRSSSSHRSESRSIESPTSVISTPYSLASVNSTSNSAMPSPTSVVSTPFSLASLSSSSTSRSGRTSRSKSSSRAATSATQSVESQSSGRFTIQMSLPSSVSPSSTVNATNPFPASSATATPSAGCGEQGDSTVNFDNLPRFLPANNQTQPDITQAPPVPNPYYHLTFSDGYVYAPEPSEPYQPSSPPHLAVFLANATGKTATPFGDLVKPGEIGDGPRESISAFWFDAKSAYFGCDNPGPEACTLVLSAYTWSSSANDEILTYAQNVTIPACPSLTGMNCQLQKVDFSDSFKDLTGLQVQAFTGSDQRMFFMDDLALSWSNSSCAAGLLRQSSS